MIFLSFFFLFKEKGFELQEPRMFTLKCKTEQKWQCCRGSLGGGWWNESLSTSHRWEPSFVGQMESCATRADAVWRCSQLWNSVIGWATLSFLVTVVCLAILTKLSYSEGMDSQRTWACIICLRSFNLRGLGRSTGSFKIRCLPNSPVDSQTHVLTWIINVGTAFKIIQNIPA